MKNEVEQNIQLAILGKSLVNHEVCNKMLEAVSIGNLVFAGKCEYLFYAISNSLEQNGVCDALTVIETFNEAHIKDAVSIVRSAIDESKKMTVDEVMLEIKKILLPSENEKLFFTDEERLKMLNDEILEVAAECIANKHVKKIEIGKKDNDVYIVRLKGGLSIIFSTNQSPAIYLSAGNDINRFPMSYKFVEDLYKELSSTQEEVKPEPEKSVESKKPKSFFEKFLK